MAGRGKIGSAKCGGRQKGTPNKSTASAKEALQLAFEGIGGIQELQSWAKMNQTEFYRIWSKIIPTTLAGDSKNPLFPKLQVVLNK